MKPGVFKKVRQFFYDIKIKHKLLLSFLVLTVIPIGLISFLTFNTSSDIIHSYITYSATQSFNQTHNFISYKLYKVINTLDIIALDSKLNDILMKDVNRYSNVDQVQDMMDLKLFLKSFEDEHDIYRTRIYVRSGLIYSNENRNIFNADEVKNTLWYKKLMSKKTKILCCPYQYLKQSEPSDPEILSMAVVIKNRNQYDDIIGLLRLDIRKDSIIDILNSANPTDDSLTYLVNSEGIIVASSSEEIMEKYRHDAVNLIQNEDGTLQEAQISEVSINNERVYFLKKLILGTDWVMVTIIPYSAFLAEIQRLGEIIILLVLIIGTVVYMLAYGIARSVTTRLDLLISKMRDIQKGKTDIVIENNDRDEIGVLFNDFNFMVQRLSALIEEQYKMGQELKSAELKALQSQINPHFLYNTLDMINWMSQKNLIAEINSVVNALANFYKLTLNRGKDIVTIREELMHLSYYVQIQNFRFRNAITIKIDVEEEIMDYLIPKITLQPIVENSIQHGILKKKDKKGTIIVEGRLEKSKGSVLLSVKDDGVGIPDDRLANIMAGEILDSEGSHYGLRNINQRIELLYGKEYGLIFESIPGIGTTVDVHLPALRS